MRLETNRGKGGKRTAVQWRETGCQGLAEARSVCPRLLLPGSNVLRHMPALLRIVAFLCKEFHLEESEAFHLGSHSLYPPNITSCHSLLKVHARKIDCIFTLSFTIAFIEY